MRERQNNNKNEDREGGRCDSKERKKKKERLGEITKDEVLHREIIKVMRRN